MRKQESLKGIKHALGFWDKLFSRYKWKRWSPRGKKHCKQNTRQLCSKNKMDSTLRNSTLDIRILPCSWLSVQSFSSQALTSFPTCGGPRHSPNSWVKFHPRSLCFHRLKALGRILRFMLVSARHTACWGFPPCPCVGVLKCWGYMRLALPRFLTLWQSRPRTEWKNRPTKSNGWTWVRRQ